MALEKFRNVNIQIDHANGAISNIKQFAKSGDYNGRVLVVQLTNGGVVSATTGIQVNLGWRHPDANSNGLDPFTVADASKGIYAITYPKELLQPGTVIAVIQIIDGQRIIETRNFEITVEESAIDEGAVASSNSFRVLEQALLTINQVTAAASSAAAQASSAATAANQAKEAATAAAASANSAASGANSAKTAANNAASAANTAAGQATSAAAAANQAAEAANNATAAIGDPLARSGGTMTGNINMNSNRITGLPTPSANSEPATKQMLDAANAQIAQKAAKADVDLLTGTGTTLPSGTDLNNVTSNGVYLLSGAWAYSNAPFNWAVILVFGIKGGFILQLAYQRSACKARMFAAGTWNEWA